MGSDRLRQMATYQFDLELICFHATKSSIVFPDPKYVVLQSPKLTHVGTSSYDYPTI